MYGVLTASFADFLKSSLKINVDKTTFFIKKLPGKPITTLLLQICINPEFDENTITCGTDCCDGSNEQTCMMDSGEKKCDASPTPTPTMKTSRTYTDPHLVSFDDLSFSCHKSCEFLMATSKKLQEEVQARFSGPDRRVSATTGIAVKGSSGSVFQCQVRPKTQQIRLPYGHVQLNYSLTASKNPRWSLLTRLKTI